MINEKNNPIARRIIDMVETIAISIHYEIGDFCDIHDSKNHRLYLDTPNTYREWGTEIIEFNVDHKVYTCVIIIIPITISSVKYPDKKIMQYTQLMVRYCDNEELEFFSNGKIDKNDMNYISDLMNDLGTFKTILRVDLPIKEENSEEDIKKQDIVIAAIDDFICDKICFIVQDYLADKYVFPI